MKLTVLGSGTGIIRKERSSAAFLLEKGQQNLLLDCGWGAGIRMTEVNFEIQQLDHILISHPHADHMGNLMNILQSMLVSGYFYPNTKRSKPLYLHGYKGFEKDYETLRKIMFPERVEPYEIHIHEHHSPTDFFKLENISIQGQPVHHVPEHFHSNAYRIETGGKSIVYSGDCGYDERFIQLCQEADLSLMEISINPQMFKEQGPRPNHLSPFECGAIAQKANVKTLALFHRYDLAKPEEIEAEVRKNFAGDLILTEDRQVIEI